MNQRRESRVSPVSAGAHRLVILAPALAGAWSCTLSEDSYDPIRIGSLDAGAVSGGGVSTSLGAEPSEQCPGVAEGNSPSARDTSCDVDIRGFDLGDSQSADAGATGTGSEGLTPLLLPRCTSGFGPFGAPEILTGVEFEENVFGPALSSDGKTLYFSAYVSGEQQIYSATRSGRDRAFSDVAELDVINSNDMDGSPFLAGDGRRLYFFSDRDAGPGDRDLWVSEQQLGAFGEPELVRGVNTQSSELLPWLSKDELTLFFVSARSGGRGGADLWRATRDSAFDAFDTPTNIADLSSGQNEGRLVLSSDGRTAYFSSSRGGGQPDIWTATRASTGQAFSNIRTLDQLNSPAPDQDVFLSPDDTELFFASQRGGKSELWRAVRSCE